MKKQKKKKRFKFKFFLSFVVFGGVTSVLGYNLLCNMLTINKMVLQKAELKEKIVSLEQEKEVLESDIQKLEEPDYIGKYVREKYYYSKDGELILRIEE